MCSTDCTAWRVSHTVVGEFSFFAKQENSHTGNGEGQLQEEATVSCLLSKLTQLGKTEAF